MSAAAPLPVSLLRTPTPYRDESLNGLFLRVAEQNGYENSSWLLKQAGMNLKAAVSPCDLSSAARVMRIDVEELKRRVYWPPKGRSRGYVSFLETEVRNFHLQLDPCKVCPHCLAASQYCRAFWDIRLAAICPDHGHVLADRCGHCTAPISWRRQSVTICNHCGADFRNILTLEAQAPEILLTKIMQNALLGGEFRTSIFPDFVPLIPAVQLLDLIKFLGGYGLEPGGALSRVRLPRRNPGQVHLLFRAAANALSDWPHRFHELLDLIRSARSEEVSRTGISGNFGEFYIHLMRRFSAGPKTPVREAFLSYIRSSAAGAFPTRRGHRFDYSGDRAFMSRPEVAEFLGISAQTVDVLHREGEITGNTHPWGMTRTHGVFDRASVEAYEDRRRHIIDSRSAAARLGLSNVTFRKLVESGLLKPHQRATYRPRKAYEIDERRIDELLQSLDLVVTDLPYKAGTSYHNATIRLGHVGLTGADLLRAALRCDVKISNGRRGFSGLQRYLFDLADIERMIRKFSSKLPARESLLRTADALRIDTRAASRLFSHGALKTHRDQTGSCIVPDSELRRFQDKYITVRELARLKGRPVPYVLDLYCGAGLSPLLGRSLGMSNAFLDRQRAAEIFKT